MSIENIKIIQSEEEVSLKEVFTLLKSLQKEISVLRTDVDKLIENGR